MSKILIGSKALLHHFPDLGREQSYNGTEFDGFKDVEQKQKTVKYYE